MTGRLSLFEKTVLVLTTLLLLIGYGLFYTDNALWQAYIKEDGIIEWLTVAAILISAFTCLYRFVHLRGSKQSWFLFVTLAMALVLVAGAGEELSWGQRIFDVKSPEFFAEKNLQGETNIHNLMIGGMKLNKVIFSQALGIVFAVYLLVFPILYHRNMSFKKFIDRSGVMIAARYQIVTIFVMMAALEIIRDGKRAELQELALASVFLLIVLYPRNREIYQKN